MSHFLYRNAFGFLVPYLLIYLLAEWVGLSANVLKWIFRGLHAVNLISISVWAHKESKNKEFRRSCYFFVGLTLAFLASGAYLEFPSDPWEHLRRILLWEKLQTLSEHPFAHKFAYFWNWTWFADVPIANYNLIADGVSAFWQVILAIQFYLLALRLGSTEPMARIYAFSTVISFGTNLFSFRYYALSSTPLAYVAYLRSLIFILDGVEGKRINWIGLALTIPMIYFNHLQELIFLGIAGSTIICSQLCRQIWPRLKTVYRKIAWAAFTAFVLTSIYIGFKAPRLWTETVPRVVAHAVGTYSRDWTDVRSELSGLGTFPIWKVDLSYYETIGATGVLSIISAIILLKRYRLMATLTLIPVGLMLFPPFAIVLSLVASVPNSYRVLYTFPHSFMLTSGLFEVARLVTAKLKLGNVDALSPPHLITVALLIMVSIPHDTPWRGRGLFQWFKPSHQLSLKHAQTLANELNVRGMLRPRCYWLTDHATDFALATFGSMQPVSNRLSTNSPIYDISTESKLNDRMMAHAACGVILHEPTSIKPIESWIGRSSKHWNPWISSHEGSVPDSFRKLMNDLASSGSWIREQLTPNYWVYQPKPRS